MPAGAKRSLQPKFDAAEARIAGLSLPKGGVWATEARKGALARLVAMGMPHGRDEYWRFTRPDTLVQPAAVPATVFEHHESQIFAGIDRLHLVFRDGVLDAAASDPLALEAVEIQPLAEAAAADIHWARELYGVLEAAGQSPVERPLAALNTAFASEGLAIRVTGKAGKPLHLTYLQSGPETDVMMHHVLRLEPGADLTILENGPAAARLTKVMEVDIADGAAFHHIRTQGRAHERRAATHIFARLGAASTFKSFTLTANGALTRNEVVVEFTGDDAVAHVSGAALGDGHSGAFHHDDTVFITHDAVGCESRQVFKKVLRNGATGVFQGKILVKPGAQKTDGYQISQSLLLGEDSQFLAKPELEIYADDVACSHGSTSGALDETALFYLRSRGVPTEIATDLLIAAFVAEAIAEIEDPAIAEVIRERLDSWLARRRG